MNRHKKLFSNTVILGLGTFGSKLLVFLLMPLYTSLLSTSEYSTAELITSTANLLIPLACVGISNGIFRFAAERESDQKAVFSASVALLTLGLGGFCLLSPLLSLITYFSGYTWLIVAYVFFADVQAVCAQYVRAIDRTRLFALQGVLNTLLTILCNILFLVVWDMGVTGYVLSVIVGNILTTVYLIFAAKLWRVFSISSINRRMMKDLLYFSLPLIPTTVCWLITDLSDRYMVTYFWGSDVNGVYSAAYKIPTVVNLISGIFMQAWQFSAVAESSDEDTCKTFYSEVFRGFLSVIFIGAAGLILFSRFLADLLLSRAYFEAWRYMPTLLCAAALESIVSFLATVYMVRKKSMHSFLSAMVGTLLNVVLNLLLIPTHGALGAAIATMLAYGAVLIVRMIDAPRIIRFKLCLPRLCVNVVLLLCAAAIMTFDPMGRFWWTLAITVAMIAINAPTLLGSLKRMLMRRRKQ
ncbi:MAG: oligosaccharide flippase family protein [Clostridia bacterium]|nr:oligosaccharide flippase family protein [Clostridia bacterium]